jgi:hypothetical protein
MPPLLDSRDELTLPHLRDPGDALGLGDPLKLRQQHRGKARSLAAGATLGT